MNPGTTRRPRRSMTRASRGRGPSTDSMRFPRMLTLPANDSPVQIFALVRKSVFTSERSYLRTVNRESDEFSCTSPDCSHLLRRNRESLEFDKFSIGALTIHDICGPPSPADGRKMPRKCGSDDGWHLGDIS